MAFLFIILAVSAAAAGLVYIYLFVGRRGRHYPDGPPTLPLIGNLHQLPRKGAHFKFTELAKTYGGMFSLKLGTGTAVVLTDRRIIRELLDKKSSISSNRPVSFVSQNIITGGDHLLVMDYGARWRAFRKLIHQEFMESMCEKNHIKLQNAESVQMLRDFLISPENHMLHPKRFSNSVIMSILFGIRTPSYDTPHMTKLYDLMESWSKVMETGATPPVDFYPFLRWIPEQFLGNWVRRSVHVRDEMNALYSQVISSVVKRREVSGSKDSFIDKILDKQDKLGMTMHEVYFLGGVAMEGGSDTSSAVITSCIQALTKWPHIQKKAQQEIDAVVSEDRSPVWSDYAKLPYVNAIVKEAMRWRPVTPLSFPHCLAEDEWVDSKFLPKGTIVIINVWGLHHDETKFPNHDIFDPDHYAGRTLLASEYAASADYESRDHYAYGAGRRLCPGIHLAERNLFQAISKLLWAFNFERGEDEAGGPVEPDTDPITGYSEGFLVCAKHFPCKITVRSEMRRETIMREFQRAQEEVFHKYED
ncbi:uncharacterized protein A1O5_07722 [Cladophialophora psammophila CBS 110553]|uniref:Cytochrome P450 oxidoreductase n=1 Tax=Cladophialophora psammophila CBS 110553 TaxID=1182543 RepID=W9WVV9_9EURO|nr:uncharacterized protein A1O5_07722 [Cladophialophora psammophila CBS 110553]EXJ68791.1 hypothetical protein A1O5_07722 [Cladophialophora psammophila CBS 110553]